MSSYAARWWEPARPEARELARAGEIRASKVRLLVAGIGAVTAALATPFARWQFTLGYTAMLLGGAILLLVARGPAPPRWLNPFSCLFDVFLLAAVNASLVWGGDPLLATNSRVFFGVMLVFLSLTCLRLDSRWCLLSGFATVVTYAAVVIWADLRYDLTGPAFASDVSGVFSWSNQISRLVLIVVAAAINAEIVVMAREYWRDSIRDPLTGLHNRRYAEIRLEEEIATARRKERHLVIAIADLDNLKAVNDDLGHAGGDEVLRRTAAALRRFFRTSDVIARYGGDEFLLILPESDLEATVRRLEEFRGALAENAARTAADGGPPACTVSLGVASYPRDAISATNLVRRADHRLYAAKESGRNRIAAG